MNPDAVRPGTSDALTARTIDATQYSPLIRAQETAVALVPRLAQAAVPLSSPLFLGALALTLVFSWIAIRMRYRPSALLLGALLVMALTSFKPVGTPQQAQTADSTIPRTTRTIRPSHWNRVYTPARQTEAPDVYVQVDPVQVYLPPDFAERIPDWSRDAVQSAERMIRENERMQEMMKQIRHRLHEEVRNQRWRQMLAQREARLREFDLVDSP